METIKTYLLILLLTISLIQGYLLYSKHQSSKDFELKYSKLQFQSEELKKEIEKLKKESNNVVVPDLKEDEVVDYWKGYLK